MKTTSHLLTHALALCAVALPFFACRSNTSPREAPPTGYGDGALDDAGIEDAGKTPIGPLAMPDAGASRSHVATNGIQPRARLDAPPPRHGADAGAPMPDEDVGSGGYKGKVPIGTLARESRR